MIIYHSRTLIHQYLSYEMLKYRYPFGVETIDRQERMKKGYSGESLADHWLTDLFTSSSCLYLCDLRLNIDFEQLQIDSLIIFDQTVIVLEIKNYSMDLIYQNGHFYRQSGEILTSLHTQLGKIRRLMSKLIADYDSTIEVKVMPFFVNSKQQISGLLLDGDVLVPGNYQHVLAPYIASRAPRDDLARYLVSLNQANDFDRKLEIDYDSVSKGIYCKKCHQPLTKKSQRQYGCSACGQVYNAHQVVSHQLKVYRYIWADRPVTTKTAYEWMDGKVCWRTLQRILANKTDESLIP